MSTYGSLPEGWNEVELMSVSSLITDGAHSSPKPQTQGRFMCSVKDMTYNKFDFSNVKLISEEDYQFLVKQGCAPQKGDLLISKDGANCLDLLFLYDQEAEIVLLSSIAIVRLKDTVYKEYVRYFLLSPDCQFIMRNNYVSGSAIPRVVLKDFKKVPVVLPPLPEQKAIASVLSSLDDKIDLLHRQNQTLEAMAETLFRQWFIEEAREDWEETTLEHHIVAIKGLSYKGSGLCDVGQGIPMFNLNSVLEGGGYKTTGLKYYKGDYKERHLVKADDIIVANTEQGHEHRLIGFPAVIPSYFNGENIFTHHIFKVSTLESTYLTNQFIYYLLRSSAVREQITGATNGSTVNQLAADGLQRPKFRLPPKNLVQSFTNQVISFWRKKDLNQQQIWSLENLRDTLLPKLMSGEMRVQYQTEEVA